MATLVRKIRVIVTEGVSIFAWIILQSSLWLGRFHICRTNYWVVGGFEGALAIPSVAWVVFVPERIIDRECKLHEPVCSMAALWLVRCSRHPTEVWEYVFIALELSPVGSSMSSNDGCVIFGLEPWSDLVCGNRFHFVDPFGERF